MKYSVIIPAYNAEATIRRCLDSIVGQLPGDAQILLVNDGSADGTEEICRSYEEKYPQIHLLSKPNGGVSSARNLGLDNADGEYILFADADDALFEGYFRVMDEALEGEPDLLQFRKVLMGKPSRNSGNSAVSVFSEDLKRTSRILSRNLRKQELNMITTKAFRREIIEAHRIRFDERLDIGEDKVFAFTYALHAKRLKMISTPLYYLSVEDPNSLSRKKRDHLCESVLLEHSIMKDLLADSEMPEDCKEYYRNALSYSFFRSAYTVVGELRKFDSPKKERIEKTRTVLDRYSCVSGYQPKELICRMIAHPVLKKQASLIDSVMGLCLKRGEAWKRH